MNIVITVTSFQRLTPGQDVEKIFTSLGGTIGRSADMDWTLPDPEKVISKQHARIEYQQNTFYVLDTSTNGVFVNEALEPLGNQSRHPLSAGDTLRMGDYVLKVSTSDAKDKSTSETNVDRNATSTSPEYSTMTPVSGAAPSSTGKKVVHLSQEQDAFQPPRARLPDNWNYTDVGIEEPVADVPTQSTDTLVQKNDNPAPAAQGSSIDMTPLLMGLGLDKETALSSTILFELGKSLRDLLDGMLEIMAARAELKSEFRVMQTTIRSEENNPLKFSIDTNEMIQNLFFRDLKGFLKPKEAIAEAFRDLNAHEIALMAGVQSAVNGILDELSPDSIRQKPYASSGLGKLLPGSQYARYWRIYADYYQEIRQSMADGNNRFIDADFAKAYEQKLSELK